MTSPDMSRLSVTSLAVFTLAMSVVTCDDVGEFPPCSPETCIYKAPTRQLDCDNIGCGTLQGFSNWSHTVETLTVRGNHLVNVTSQGFPCHSLLKIDLSDNNISFIDHYAFRDCKNLTSVVLDRNKLKIDIFYDPARNPLFGKGSLSHLSLASNQIGDLVHEPFSGEILSLRFLNLSDNGIGLIDYKSVSDMKHLEVLDLSRNELENLDDRPFRGLTALRQLNLSHNLVLRLPANVFAECGALSELDLSQNAISDLHQEAFSGLYSLKILRLSSNPFRSLPVEFPATLEKLYLENNPNLISLDYSNALGPSLTWLTISNCASLKEISWKTTSLPRTLSRIEITDNCRLATVAKDAFGGPNCTIRHLNLSHNALTTLDKDLLNWRAVEEGDLSGNSWNCDCNLEWMRQASISASLLQTLLCSKPAHIGGRSLLSLAGHSESQLQCSLSFRYRRQMALALIVTVSALFLFSTALLVIRCRRSVLPCWFGPPNNYETLYSATSASEAALDASETETVHIIRAPAAGLSRIASGLDSPRPTPV